MFRIEWNNRGMGWSSDRIYCMHYPLSMKRSSQQYNQLIKWWSIYFWKYSLINLTCTRENLELLVRFVGALNFRQLLGLGLALLYRPQSCADSQAYSTSCSVAGRISRSARGLMRAKAHAALLASLTQPLQLSDISDMNDVSASKSRSYTARTSTSYWYWQSRIQENILVKFF